MADMTTRIQPQPEGLRVARKVARFYIGDASWAETIVDAYLNPARAEEALRAEMEADA